MVQYITLRKQQISGENTILKAVLEGRGFRPNFLRKVDRFEVVGSTVFSKQELDATLKDFVGRPLTFAQLLQARSAVSQLYISKGHITSGALIGPQTLTASVVRILVLEGKRESINVVGTRGLNYN